MPQGGHLVKFRHLIPALAALTLAMLLVGCSKKSTPTSVLPVDETPPAAPTHVVALADPGSAGAIIQWTPSTSPSLHGYEIYVYSPDPTREDSWMLLVEVGPDVTQYQLAAVTQQVTRYYRVRAAAPNGKHSTWSPIIMVTLMPPGSGTSPDNNDNPELPKPRTP
jgi:hypothetical protein